MKLSHRSAVRKIDWPIASIHQQGFRRALERKAGLGVANHLWCHSPHVRQFHHNVGITRRKIGFVVAVIKGMVFVLMTGVAVIGLGGVVTVAMIAKLP